MKESEAPFGREDSFPSPECITASLQTFQYLSGIPHRQKCPEDLQVVVYDGVFDKFNVSDDFTAVVQQIEQMAK